MTTNPPAPDAVRELVEALTKCRDQFRYYEQQHRAKRTPDGDAKADVNDAMAEMCGSLIAKHGEKG